MNGLEVQNSKWHLVASPTTTQLNAEGRYAYDSANHVLKYRDNTTTIKTVASQEWASNTFLALDDSRIAGWSTASSWVSTNGANVVSAYGWVSANARRTVKGIYKIEGGVLDSVPTIQTVGITKKEAYAKLVFCPSAGSNAGKVLLRNSTMAIASLNDKFYDAWPENMCPLGIGSEGLKVHGTVISVGNALYEYHCDLDGNNGRWDNVYGIDASMIISSTERDNWNAAYNALFAADDGNAANVIDTWEEIKKFVEQYDNTKDLATLLAGKADSATTLSGYGITDAKIVNGVITLGSETITPLVSAGLATTNTNSSNDYTFAKWGSNGLISGKGTQFYKKAMTINGSAHNMLKDANTNLPTIYAPTTAGNGVSSSDGVTKSAEVLVSSGSGAPSWKKKSMSVQWTQETSTATTTVATKSIDITDLGTPAVIIKVYEKSATTMTEVIADVEIETTGSSSNYTFTAKISFASKALVSGKTFLAVIIAA